MKRPAMVFFSMAMSTGVSAADRNSLARFEGGIGVIPASAGAGAANADGTLPNVKLNIVRGVLPGAGPWRIAELRAEIDTDGSVRVRGRGLLLASGNGIGTNAAHSEHRRRVVRGRNSKGRELGAGR